MERRIVPLSDVEVRKTGDRIGFTGYAAMFNSGSEDLGGFTERIAPGAFSKTLREADVRSLINHDANLVLGRNRAGTLRLKEDERGLRVENDLPDTSYARDLHVSLERGDVDQMSFGFRTIKDEWDEGTSPPTRTLREVQLFDVSVVTFPAYPETSAEARSKAMTFGEDPIDAALTSIASVEHFNALTEELRAGKVLSRKNQDLLAAAVDALTELLAAAEPEPQEPEANSAPTPEAATTPLAIRKRQFALYLVEAGLSEGVG